MNSENRILELICPICSNMFGEHDSAPHILPCGHSHCRKCLRNIFRGDDHECQVCKEQLPFKKAKQIPINFALLNLKSVISRDSSYVEFKDVDKKMQILVNSIDEMTKVYENSVHDTKQRIADIEFEKEKLIMLRESFKNDNSELARTKSLTRSMSLMQSAMQKMKELENQSELIEKKLEKGRKVMSIQLLLRECQNFCISKDGLKASYFISTKKIYMYRFSRKPYDNLTEVDYSVLHDFFSGVFMIFEYNDRQVKLDFEVLKCPRGKQFINMCMNVDKNYEMASFLEHSRVGQEGESTVVGFDVESKSQPASNDFKKQSTSVHIRKGYLEGMGNDRAMGTHFRIYFEDWPSRSSRLCFGKLTRGGSILRTVLKNGYEAKIITCGLIFDPSL